MEAAENVKKQQMEDFEVEKNRMAEQLKATGRKAIAIEGELKENYWSS